MGEMVKCPHCNGPGELQLVHIHPGGWRRQRCRTCDGTNQIDAELARRMEMGRLLRQRRIDRTLSLREEAKRIGASPVVLSHVEVGHLTSPEHYALWNRLTGEKLTPEVGESSG